MTDDNYDSPTDADDRAEWDRLWGARTLRRLPGECRLALPAPSSNATTLAPDPVEFADRVPRESEVCPVCGQSTAGSVRVAASLTVEWTLPADYPADRKLSYLLGVWVHQFCFDCCPDTGQPAGIPW